MRYNDLPEKCKSCQHLKAWSLDMGGNHGMTCRKGDWNFKKFECENYKMYEVEGDDDTDRSNR